MRIRFEIKEGQIFIQKFGLSTLFSNCASFREMGTSRPISACMQSNLRPYSLVPFFFLFR